MASRAQIGENLPDTLPADFGDWDTPEVKPVPLPEPTAVPAGQREFEPAEARPQNEQAIHSVPFAEPPRAFAGAADNMRRIPSSTSAYPVSDAYLRRLRSLNTPANRPPAASVKAEPNAYTRATEVQQKVVEEAAVDPSDDSEFRALFHSPETMDSEEQEHSAGTKWKLIFAVATGSILLVAFQFFHSGAVSKVGHMMGGQQIAASSLNTAFESPAASASTSSRMRSGATPGSATLKRPDVTAQSNNSSASQNARPSAPDQAQARMMREQLAAPARISQNARRNAPAEIPQGGVAGIEALNGSTIGNVFGSQSRPSVRTATAQPLAVSAGVAAGMLIHQTPPVYPMIAKNARVSGVVVIHATITKAGTIANARAVSGPSLLQQAALDAVKTWRFRPYKLNNEPTEVDSTVNVRFALDN